MSTRSQAPRQASSGESSSQRQSWCPAEISQEKLLWNLHLGTWEAQRAWWILTHDHMLTGKEWKERGSEIHEDGQPRTDHWTQATLTSYRRCLVSGNQNQQYQQCSQANPPSSPSIQREENIPRNFWSWNSHRPDTTKSSDSLPSAFLSGSTRPNPQQSITCNTMIISIYTNIIPHHGGCCDGVNNQQCWSSKARYSASMARTCFTSLLEMVLRTKVRLSEEHSKDDPLLAATFSPPTLVCRSSVRRASQSKPAKRRK